MDIGDDQFQTMLKVAMNSSDEIRGHVLSASNSSVATRKVSLVTIECIQKSLDNGMAMVKSCTQKEKITGADRLLSAVIQCAQHDLVKFLGMFDKVDPTLFKTRDCLFEIQREFICLRNEKTVSRVCGQEINQGNRLVDMINAVASTKDKYETDHGFLNEAGSVAGGQRLLKALLNECLCLLVQCL